MPELVERGHLYIAQPPLYRAKRGESLRYLKDDRELENHLITNGIQDSVLTMADGTQIAGQDLRDRVAMAVRAKHLMEPLIRKVDNAQIVQQAAILGTLNPDILASSGQAQQAADFIAKRLDALAPDTERGWQGSLAADGGLAFQRTFRGVTERHVLDGPLIRSSEARRLDAMAGDLQDTFAQHSELAGKDESYRITGPIPLVDAVFRLGRKGITFSRYKGLGEMNPGQLWETTLDPEARALLQGEGLSCRRGGGHILDTHGRRGGAAPRVHSDPCPRGRQPRRLGLTQTASPGERTCRRKAKPAEPNRRAREARPTRAASRRRPRSALPGA